MFKKGKLLSFCYNVRARNFIFLEYSQYSQCKDKGYYSSKECSDWKEAGHCNNENQKFMWDHCRKTCSFCVPGMKPNMIFVIF